MIPLIEDDGSEIGNALWIEDLWEPQIEALFPKDLQKIILDAHNQFQSDIANNFTPQKDDFNFHYCATDLKTPIYDGKNKYTHIAVSKKWQNDWANITKAYTNLLRLLDKDQKTDFKIHCRPIGVKEIHVTANGGLVSAAILDSSFLHYHLKNPNASISILKTASNEEELINEIFNFLDKRLNTKKRKELRA